MKQKKAATRKQETGMCEEQFGFRLDLDDQLEVVERFPELVEHLYSCRAIKWHGSPKLRAMTYVAEVLYERLDLYEHLYERLYKRRALEQEVIALRKKHGY